MEEPHNIQEGFLEEKNPRTHGTREQIPSYPLTAVQNQGGFVLDLRLGGGHKPSDYCKPSCVPSHPNQAVLGLGCFCFPLPLLWDEKTFINDFRLISLPSGRRWVLPSHHALKTDRVFCPGLKRTLFAEQSEQHVKRRRRKKKESVMFTG